MQSMKRALRSDTTPDALLALTGTTTADRRQSSKSAW
jgi:hypothetical protein